MDRYVFPIISDESVRFRVSDCVVSSAALVIGDQVLPLKCVSASDEVELTLDEGLPLHMNLITRQQVSCHIIANAIPKFCFYSDDSERIEDTIYARRQFVVSYGDDVQRYVGVYMGGELQLETD